MSSNSKFINDVICAMAVDLDSRQLQKLESILNNNLHGKQISNECTELSTYSDDNDYVLRVFAANKKLENLSDKSISQYVRTTRNMLLTLDKNYRDVTSDDIKYYLAMYQSRNKVSMNTLANTKRFISAFFYMGRRRRLYS
ncbi:phage integrase N-terminal SAM-like domain-containing protein [Lachnoclostridium sp.]|uniref:phage integrase N-terminal SAM-like domain-containing protein n=1 Tax=Lachnoclostridium sp. TaxID=2028282 RepID=UPI0028A20361|nr:phage integrase N-terminal SAM-like domain-containing protein [Lachnoclostridium sp.]